MPDFVYRRVTRETVTDTSVDVLRYLQPDFERRLEGEADFMIVAVPKGELHLWDVELRARA